MNTKLIFYILGGIGLISGVVLLVSFNPLFDFILEKQLVLSEDSFSYDMWKELPDDLKMYTRLYYFNVTNAEDVERTRGEIKPLIEEVGPYVWREKHNKSNIVWNENGTVTYQQAKTWVEFEGDESRLDDIIVTINIIALSAAEYARTQANPFYIQAIDGIMKSTGSGMFMSSSVRNLTFEGIKDPMIDAATENDLGLPIKYDKFGWFYPRNESLEYDGTFEMWTGETSIDNVGQISGWNYAPRISESVYTEECAMLNGSAGEFFPPGRGKDYVDFFSPDLCRSIRFEYDEKTNVEGASGYKYKLGTEFVSNSTVVPENSCYNPSPAPDFNLPTGLLNVTACKFNAPAYVSYPHFMDVDPMILDEFHENSKIKANRTAHSSYMSLDPKSGIPLEVAIRLQINGLARPLSHYNEEYDATISVSAFDDIPPTFYPLIWFETVTKIDPSTSLGKQVILVTKLPTIMYGVGGAVAAIGAVTILINFVVAFNSSRKNMV